MLLNIYFLFRSLVFSESIVSIAVDGNGTVLIPVFMSPAIAVRIPSSSPWPEQEATKEEKRKKKKQKGKMEGHEKKCCSEKSSEYYCSENSHCLMFCYTEIDGDFSILLYGR
jgi:hypothetical protein